MPVGDYVLNGTVSFTAGTAMRCTAWHQISPGGGANGKISFATAPGSEWTLAVAVMKVGALRQP